MTTMHLEECVNPVQDSATVAEASLAPVEEGQPPSTAKKTLSPSSAFDPPSMVQKALAENLNQRNK
ncbi:unnamed protein product, partial [Ilex paraguariensis]